MGSTKGEAMLDMWGNSNMMRFEIMSEVLLKILRLLG
jgi:hypothetical protein